MFMHELWVAPLNIFVVVGILISQVGPSSIYGYIGGSMCMLVLVAMSFISVGLVKARKAVSEVEAKQTSLFCEVLENIRTLRFYGWDTFMLQKLHAMTDAMEPLRRKLIILKMLNIGTSFLVTPMMSLVLLSAYAATTGRMDADYLYAVQSLFDITKYALLALPSAVRACSAASAAYTRITDYFHRPPYDDRRELVTHEQPAAAAASQRLVHLLHLPVGPKSLLREWRAEPGSLWVFQGPVRSYKTTLLECIAGKLRARFGAHFNSI
jgi:ABC-type transport system involved in cytochrome bd biosynthesis fused ATPase/permease subunit